MRTKPIPLQKYECPRWDRWVGDAEALIAAGIVTRDQLPSREPGQPKILTFYRGKPTHGEPPEVVDEHWMVVTAMTGRRYDVSRAVSAHVYAAREKHRCSPARWRELELEGQEARARSPRPADECAKAAAAAADPALQAWLNGIRAYFLAPSNTCPPRP